MKLIHNYYIDFLKGFKYFLTDVFQDRITRYEFNYGNKSVLQYNMYKEMDMEYPNCYISLTNIRQETSLFQQNKQGNVSDLTKSEKIAYNISKKESLLVDFKWVTLSIQVKLNFENSMDVLDFFNYYHDQIPGTNFMFYFYKYINFIDLEGFLNDWEDSDELENIYSKVEYTSDKIKRYSTYFNEPIINCVSATKNIDNENEIFGIDLDFEIQLQIPYLISKLKDAVKIENIDITIDTRFVNPGDAPLITNIGTNALFTTENIRMIYLVDIEDIDIQDNYIELNIKYKKLLEDSINKIGAFYILDDYAKSNFNSGYFPFDFNDLVIKENENPELNKLMLPIDFDNDLYNKSTNFLESYRNKRTEFTSVQLILFNA